MILTRRSLSGARRARRAILASFSALLVTLLAPTTALTAPAYASATSTPSTMESEFVARINADRTARGLAALQVDSKLAGTSRTWSSYMAAAGSISHDPQLAAHVTAIEPDWTRIGENVGYGGSVSGLHDAFMNSSGHRANILGAYNRLGVGVVVQNGTIWVTVRFLQGPALPSAPPPIGTRTALVADFDGDGHDDTFVYGPGSAADEWWSGRANGTFVRRSANVSGWYRPIAGDFDGDGRAEIVWYGPGTQRDSVWEWNGSSWTSKSLTVSGTYSPVAGDFDGDGHHDIAWYGVGTRSDALSFGTSTLGSFSTRSWSANGTYKVASGDFDGDGRDDLVLHGLGTAPDVLAFGRADRAGFSTMSVSVNGFYKPVAADLDGDGRDDLVWYGTGSNPDKISYMGRPRGAWETVSTNVSGSYLPSAGDFDGDRVGDVLWYSPSSASGDPIWWGQLGASPASAPLST